MNLEQEIAISSLHQITHGDLTDLSDLKTHSILFLISKEFKNLSNLWQRSLNNNNLRNL